MKILICGNGWLGKKYADFFGARISPFRITDARFVQQELRDQKPDVVINCAGKTGKPNIDWCEDNKLETLVGNVTVPLILAQACLQQGVYFVHLSSGCIYEGDNNGKGFSETDVPNFSGSFYSRTKILAENTLKEFPVLILRLRMPLDGAPDGRNFITKITNYKKVISIPNSITVIDDLLAATKELVAQKAVGIYNVVNPSAISHAEILEMYKQIVDPNHTYKLISLDELHSMTKAKRSNCVLDSKKLETAGVHLRLVNEAVKDCLKKYKENLSK